MAIVRVSNVKFNLWDELKTAVNEIVQKGIYEELVDIHAARHPMNINMGLHRMHGRGGDVGKHRFLPWHRAYLIMFERELREINTDLSIPYWDWDNDRGKLKGFEDYLPDIPDKRPRELGFDADGNRDSSTNNIRWFSSYERTISLETSTEIYASFTNELEQNQHNIGHDWVGGNMADVKYSPRDIVFWLHHAAVDRVWDKWQKHNFNIFRNESTESSDEVNWTTWQEQKPLMHPQLEGVDEKLDPWADEFNVKNISDISNLDNDSYSYQDPQPPTSAS